MMNRRELLGEARRLIADRERWCGGALARDVRGREVLPESDDACRWCVEGAMHRAASVGRPVSDRVVDGAFGSLQAAALKMAEEQGWGAPGDRGGPLCAARVNDELGHAGALALLDRAAFRCPPPG